MNKNQLEQKWTLFLTNLTSLIQPNPKKTQNNYQSKKNKDDDTTRTINVQLPPRRNIVNRQT